MLCPSELLMRLEVLRKVAHQPMITPLLDESSAKTEEAERICKERDKGVDRCWPRQTQRIKGTHIDARKSHCIMERTDREAWTCLHRQRTYCMYRYCCFVATHVSPVSSPNSSFPIQLQILTEAHIPNELENCNYGRPF